MTGPIFLPFRNVPDEVIWSVALNARIHLGHHARHAAVNVPVDTDVAIDIETPSVTDSFSIKCVTAAWDQHGQTYAILLDPLRVPTDAAALRTLIDRAGWLILHGAPFDVPGLVAANLMRLDHIAKVMDTLLLARSALPDDRERKSLEALALRVLKMPELAGAKKLAQKASGLTSDEKWYGEGDIHIPAYRNGAIADTIVTLRLAYPVFEMAIERQLNHPFSTFGCTTRDQAAELVNKGLVANRIMLRRNARGMEVDLGYLDRYVDTVHIEKERAEQTLRTAGLRPGNGLDVIKYLEADGSLPAYWPRTAPTASRPEGTLKSDKNTMELLPEHPLALAHLVVAHTTKVLGYMEKTAARSQPTGRLHAQCHIYGASATGRMSVSEPELQQFPKEARPIILCDRGSAGLASVDWSSIEPALMGWMGQDLEFIEPFEAGADIYEPVEASAGVPRKDAKTIVLATMYGQGQRRLAAKLRVDLEQARALQNQMRAAMPKAAQHMDLIKTIGAEYGLALTAAGRVLPIPRANGVPLAYKAVNYVAQGSCADLLYEAVINAGAAGVGDQLMIPMHDELICDVAAMDVVQEIMAIPPPYLIARSGGRVPVIRTDAHALGSTWTVC